MLGWHLCSLFFAEIVVIALKELTVSDMGDLPQIRFYNVSFVHKIVYMYQHLSENRSMVESSAQSQSPVVEGAVPGLIFVFIIKRYIHNYYRDLRTKGYMTLQILFTCK